MANNTVGEEVMLWAEKYWHLDKICKNEQNTEGERFSYDAFRDAIIQKIETETKERLFPSNYSEDIGSLDSLDR